MYYEYVDSPVGPFLLAGDADGLVLSSFAGGSQVRTPPADWIHDPAPLRRPIDQVQAYFSGERTRFDLLLAAGGTAFQRQVWAVLQTIPFGETRTYGQIAEIIGRPTAFRAVGAANGANCLPLIVPCHRVVGADGTLTGFGGGLETKQWLLEFEAAQ